MIHKLKSYQTQCEVYHNQSLKEFRELLVQFEVVSSQMPNLIINDVYTQNYKVLSNEIETLKNRNIERLNKLDSERVSFVVFSVFNNLIQFLIYHHKIK